MALVKVLRRTPRICRDLKRPHQTANSRCTCLQASRIIRSSSNSSSSSNSKSPYNRRNPNQSLKIFRLRQSPNNNNSSTISSYQTRPFNRPTTVRRRFRRPLSSSH